MNQPVYNVLFLCTGNSARSILAEAILNQLGQGRFKAYSAGSHPQKAVHPHAIALLNGLNIDTSCARSKSWDEFAKADAPSLDFIFTVCDNAAGETCPVWPSQPITAHWGIPDPTAIDGSEADKALAFSQAHKQLTSRISVFTALPLKSIDRMSLQKKLNEIGKQQEKAN